MFTLPGKKLEQDRARRWGDYHRISKPRPKCEGDTDDCHDSDRPNESSYGLIYWLRIHAVGVMIAINILLSATLLLVCITNGTGAINSCQEQDSDGGAQLIGQAQIPVSMESFRFQTGVRKQYTAFFGPRNASTDAAWDSILNAGLVRITKAQADSLSAPTTWSRHDPSMYVGIVEVFHQLHCLGHLRTLIYAADPTAERMKNPGHADHCIEYLRQTLTCLADVEIAPIGWDSRLQSYGIRDDTVRQCRSFDRIHEWVLDPVRHESEDI
ncbi:protein of unknown function (DUF3328) domain containing protein [Rhypophila sp. PSN 637]